MRNVYACREEKGYGPDEVNIKEVDLCVYLQDMLRQELHVLTCL